MDGGTKGERATETFFKRRRKLVEGLGCAIGGVFFSAKREKNLLGGRLGR